MHDNLIEWAFICLRTFIRNLPLFYVINHLSTLMKPYRVTLLLVALAYSLSACNLSSLLEPSDYPPRRSYLKGPDADQLSTKPFTLTQTIAFPYTGQVAKFGPRYLLRGISGHEGQSAIIDSGNLTDLPSSPSFDTFIDQSGGIWNATVRNAQTLISQYKSGQWIEYATLSGIGNFYRVVKAEPTEFRFYTSTGLVVWDVQQKVVKQTIPGERARFQTKNYSIGSDGRTLTLYDSEATRQLASWPLNQYVSVRKGISNDIWAAFEDKSRNVWFVVKDGNWDGVLLKYDGQTLRKLSLVPVGTYDSGRSVSGLTLDKAGNLWLSVDNVNYIYTTTGQWLRPQFDLINQDQYYQPIFSDDQGELTLADERGLYRIHQ